MLTVPRIRRVSGAGTYKATYTLAGTERFRLDTASWLHGVASDSDTCLPVLRCTDADGSVVAGATAVATTARLTPNPIGLTFAGPAAFVDTDAIQPPDAYTGYVLHDFGAVPITSNATLAWNQPPGGPAGGGAIWLRSAGVVVAGGQVGFGNSAESGAVTLRMTAGAAAGNYLALMLATVTPTNAIATLPFASIAVTSNVAGNVLDTSGNTALTGLVVQARAADGWFVTLFPLFYRLVNPLVAGDTVTVTLTGVDVWRIDAACNVITGLTVGNPYGPSAGGNYTASTSSSNVSPVAINGIAAIGTPKWVRGVLVMGAYSTPLESTLDVMLERGSVEHLGTPAMPALPTHGYTQATLPELHFGPGDTLSALALNSLGQPRVTDTVDDFLLWVLDE